MAVKFKNSKEIFEALVRKCVKGAQNHEFKNLKNLGDSFTELNNLGEQFLDKVSKAKLSESEYKSIMAEINYKLQKDKTSVSLTALLSLLIEKGTELTKVKLEEAKALLASME